MAQLEPIAKMVAQLSRLPGVGTKSAQRLAYHIISMPLEDVRELATAIYSGRKSIRYCSVCGNYSTDELCDICRDERRHNGQICVVRDPRDVAAMERSREYNGLYHVLHGVISPMSHVGPDERMRDFQGLYHVLHGALSPMDGVGPEDIRIKELMARLNDPDVKEVILATNPDIEGEATASYLARLIKPMGIRVTRIAHGVPVGSDLEYADEITLSKAMEGRREM